MLSALAGCTHSFLVRYISIFILVASVSMQWIDEEVLLQRSVQRRLDKQQHRIHKEWGLLCEQENPRAATGGSGALGAQ